ncbi:activating signal cointegrator 1 complex subunit 2 [Drosophila pseudoobscura]|uniref:Activating signal cointegrator 1 complex subunit 2 n=2 Tax=Drosophila pseudoobscura TaxID=7237 RepID=A0A6I8UFK4_DROPS|nr:activating signal cointegrator 1 complex subunit 2 [Drosophila pseudoobscura]
MLDNDASNNNCNPHKLPLGDLKFALSGQDGVKRHVPALDEHWVRREKPFGSYICLMSSYGKLKTAAALEEWTFTANNCRQDLEFLLGLSQHEFWSYMVYEESAMAAIVTFLQRANPYYRQPDVSDNSAQDKEIAQANQLYAQLLRLVVRLVMRLCTAKESASEWITPQQHSSLLYSNYLISVPLLFDLAIAVGDSEPRNVALLSQIFDSVLCIQPEYKKDLKEAVAFYESAFLSMQIQVENEGCEGAGGGVPIDGDLETPYDDVVLFALDCAYTLRILLQLRPELVETIEELRLVQSIANFYDLTVPMLYKNIYMVNPQANSLRWLNETRQQFLGVVRDVISSQLQGGRGQQLVELLQECLSAQTFVVDYQRQYPLEHDMQMLLNRCPNVKNYKVDFVVSGYQKAVSTCLSGVMADELDSSRDVSFDGDEEEDSTPTSPLPQATSNGSTRDIDLEVSAVLDVLPDLGMGFIRTLLTRYENSEQAIAAILDDNLPPDLAEMDRQKVYVPPDPQDKLQSQTGVRHFNVCDGDRYDVLTQDKPECIIKQGKGLPGGPRNAEQLLDDKTDVKKLKERYQQYAMVEESTHDGDSVEYDDEYDDSYEALNEGQAPPVSLLRARMQAASHLASSHAAAYEIQDQEEDDDDSSDSRSEKGTVSRGGADFCENPEVIRARYQQRQMAKYGQRGSSGAQQSAAVSGAPKGQGQTQQTQRSRGQKEAHKSSRANHNRKAGAAFKRSKGMMS